MTPFDSLEDDDLDDLPPERRLTTSEQKLQRWVDLLAALLIRHRHAPFDELAKDVPGYDLANGQRESVLRTFRARQGRAPALRCPHRHGEGRGWEHVRLPARAQGILPAVPHAAPATFAKRMFRIGPTIVPPRRVPDATVFDRLSDALARRKVITFDYHSMERDERSRREVEPYNLFFVSAHWYLAGRDVGQDAMDRRA